MYFLSCVEIKTIIIIIIIIIIFIIIILLYDWSLCRHKASVFRKKIY